jgi:hypothetical protein
MSLELQISRRGPIKGVTVGEDPIISERSNRVQVTSTGIETTKL